MTEKVGIDVQLELADMVVVTASTAERHSRKTELDVVNSIQSSWLVLALNVFREKGKKR